ncbi:ER membrane protein complex subunit 2-like [Clavelina lepadiformis]|uniref:ER membrane protein complex subunit 2 n=1 Tax=Clavelina lepadiformis TaxID=159417 RepID=A0ABP0H3F0_CLALP
MAVSWEEARDKLRELRDSNVRDGESVVDLGERLVRKYSSKLGDELWLVCEQVFIAALDVDRDDVADMCLEKLSSNFPKSSRVMKLQGMMLESQGCADEAEELYKTILAQDPTNAAVRKRLIALSKWRNWKNPGATIKMLTEYLEVFMADNDAWLELADLYIAQMDYDRAAYCMEELILSNSFNHLYHQRYAEIKYSKGGKENKELARQYFAQAVKLSNNCNMRALYGLLMTCTSLCGKVSQSEDSKNKQYATWAAKMIAEKYNNTWVQDKDVSLDGKKNVTPSKDVPQLMASVQQSLSLLNLQDGVA